MGIVNLSIEDTSKYIHTYMYIYIYILLKKNYVIKSCYIKMEFKIKIN